LLQHYFNILAKGNCIKNGGNDQSVSPPRLQCYVNHEDPEQNARTIAKEIELETELLKSILKDNGIGDGKGKEHAVHSITPEPQSEEDKRFNERMQELKRQNDMLAAHSGPNRPLSEELVQRSQFGGSQLPDTPFMSNVAHTPYMLQYPSPILPGPGLQPLPPPGFQGHPQTFNSPFQLPAYSVGQPGVGWPPFPHGPLPQGSRPQGRLYGTFLIPRSP
jgi:hypothetical protein